ncbi:MAG: 3'-5' exonuclease [Anaerolineaceae bacterium]|nr:3'-5' exonuclease [Anaerolineaceae bacterium]
MVSSLNPRQAAIQTARQILVQRPVFLDSETTGLDSTAEIVEIGIVDYDGTVLLETLVRPAHPIPNEATAIHHIDNKMVAEARAWPTIWPSVRELILPRTIAAYNADYDHRILQYSLTQYGLSWKDNLKMICIMKLYAQFRSVWDSRRGTYRYFSLEDARRSCGLSLPNAHRAIADTLLARDVLFYIAESS